VVVVAVATMLVSVAILAMVVSTMTLQMLLEFAVVLALVAEVGIERVGSVAAGFAVVEIEERERERELESSLEFELD